MSLHHRVDGGRPPRWPIQINRSDFVQWNRYVCPLGDSDWVPAGTHARCRSCKRRGDDPRHRVLVDQVTGEWIPYANFEVE